jgi:16S rRNA (uracil1498-N3)-methyltransferase
VQVLRLQPGDALTLFDGEGGEYAAAVERMGRSGVAVRVGEHVGIEREAPRAVHLAIGMPANERMDWFVEKATELGAASIQPLALERSVLRLAGERAAKKREHWQGIAIAACEQCGRNRVPRVHAIASLQAFLAGAPASIAVATPHVRVMLSPSSGTELQPSMGAAGDMWVLSGPEGGLSAAEEEMARGHGFAAVSLGPRILRAETAPLAALSLLTLAGPAG